MKPIYMRLRNILIPGAAIITLTMNGCKRLVDINAPVSYINQANVFENDATAVSVMTGIYIKMGEFFSVFTGKESISLCAGLSADEFTLSDQVTDIKLISYYQNNLSVNLSTGSEMWEPLYRFIFYCNSAIEGLQESTTLTPSVKQQLLGEAKFVRAYCFFYLVNLFGDVPLAISSDYKVNSTIGRSPESKIYEQIVTDLKDAQELLSFKYVDGSLQNYSGNAERVRPTKWAATALLARVYLYTLDFANAEAQASLVINNSALYGLPALNNVFLKNNIEAIWQLQPTLSGWNSSDARVLIINGVQGNDKPVYLNLNLLTSFEPGDARSVNWIKDTTIQGVKYKYPYKYKSASLNAPITEYVMMLRLGEQYLIRAEARAQQNNINGAQSDLNVIRNRAILGTITANDKNSILTAIMQERRVELFAEWGHRWLDLKRTNNVDAIMMVVASQKGGTWQNYKRLYPLPLIDIERNPILQQNPEY